MQSQIESERLSARTNLISIDRPDSSQLVDLHVYIIPKNVWKDRQNLAQNEAMEQAISAGFVHVSQNLTIQDLRQQIINICGQDNDFPKEFIYLRSVGRCLTKVRPQQETELKVKNYRPPMTFAPEIYLLEGGHHEHDHLTSNSKNYLFRESPIDQPLTSPPQTTTSPQQNWVKPIAGPPPQPLTKYPLSAHLAERENSINFNGPAIASFSNLSTASSTLSARDLAKLREEQERLRLRQNDLARQRREIEQEYQRRTKESLEKQKNSSKEQQVKEEVAATRIQAAYRGYRQRRKIKQQKKRRQLAANEIERLQREARELTRRKAEEEHAEEMKAHDVAKFSDRLEQLRTNRMELEANREAIVRRMQQLHAQISVRRKEERDIWKQKYLAEKKKTTALEERTQTTLKDEPDMNSQVEQAKIRLNNSIKLRQQAENECRLLKQELQQIRLSMNTLEKNSLPKQQQQQQTLPITLGITLQY